MYGSVDVARTAAFVTLVFYAPSISGNVYLIWTVLFSGDDYGYVNSLLLKLGLIYQPVQWLQNANTVLIIVILVSLWMSLGTGFLSLIAALCGYPTTDYAAHTVMNHLTDYGTIRFEMGYASAIAVFLFFMMVGTNLLIKHFLSRVGE